MSRAIASFDTGTRTEIDEQTTHHGSGWEAEDGSTVLCPSPDLKLVIGSEGELSVWYNRERVW